MIVRSSFIPPWYLRNAHLQTVLANIIQPPMPEVSIESVELPDGDRLSLARGTASGNKTLLILHGLEGSLKSAYPKRLIQYLNEREIPVAMMFFRGCDGRPNRLARSYHSGDTGDLSSVIQYLRGSGSNEIALVGYSLGGNVTLKYLGEAAVDPAVRTAIAVSVPLVLELSARRMSKGLSRVYQHSLLKRLKQKVAQKRQLLEAAGLKTDTPTTNFYEFDDAFTAPVHGFDSALHYYDRSSSRQFLKHIDRPTLIIHAKDDPFMTEEVIPGDDELAEEVVLELSDHGGHVGFIEKGILRQSNWLEPRILTWLEDHFL